MAWRRAAVSVDSSDHLATSVSNLVLSASASSNCWRHSYSCDIAYITTINRTYPLTGQIALYKSQLQTPHTRQHAGMLRPQTGLGLEDQKTGLGLPSWPRWQWPRPQDTTVSASCRPASWFHLLQ